MNRMGRSTWGLESDTTPRPDWLGRARCRQPDMDPDLWHAHGEKALAEAAHICLNHCRVFVECLKAAGRHPPEGGVQAADYYPQRGLGKLPGWVPDVVERCRICSPPTATEVAALVRRQERYRRELARKAGAA